MIQELFPIVSEDGTVIGSATRNECHSGSKLLHPVVHLHIIDELGRILLQKRSDDKDIQPGKWDTSVGGHVDYGESIGQALVREVSEELGLYDFSPVALSPYIFESEIERELVNLFITRVSAAYPFHFQQSEISEIRFWTHDDIMDNISAGIFTPNFISEYLKIYPQLQTL